MLNEVEVEKMKVWLEYMQKDCDNWKFKVFGNIFKEEEDFCVS